MTQSIRLGPFTKDDDEAALKTDFEKYWIATKEQDISHVNQFGQIGSSPVSQWHDIYNETSANKQFFTVAQKIFLKSTSSDDIFGGAGARQVRVIGIDAQGNVAEEFINMNGLANTVSSVNVYWHINRMEVYTAGNLGVGQGNITAWGETLGDSLPQYVQSTIKIDSATAASLGTSTDSHIMVPNGSVGVVSRIAYDVFKDVAAAPQAARFRLVKKNITRPEASPIFTTFFRLAGDAFPGSSGARASLDLNLRINANEVVWVQTFNEETDSVINSLMEIFFI